MIENGAKTGRRVGLLALALTALAGGCASLQQLAALRRVAFALEGVQDGRLAGVELRRLRDYSGLSASEIARIALAVGRKDLPLEMRVNVRAENPSDNEVTARMLRLGWSLLLNDRETISGAVDTTIVLPPGSPRTFPLAVRLNLVEFFDGSARDLVNIAAAVAGFDADPTKLSIRAVPTIDTPLGPISYPSPITIVSTTVR